ncbi:MAG: 1,4-dihydroxy-2-naphthoate octaprenyltransferase [Candidatus Omnitrophica bacterium]|nr:1,4-dihydroxy-2-naphthoate octaprenyltransferase [Candidatus Omnitrophota bacterium]
MAKFNLKIWLTAVRPFSFTASIMPVILGGCLVWGYKQVFHWDLFLAFLFSALFIHAGTNLFSDYYDFTRGVDKPGTFGSSGILTSGTLQPVQILNAARLMLVLGFVIGLFLVARLGWPILVLGLIGMLGGYSYCGRMFGYKYLGLGEIFVFLFMGVLLFTGIYFVLTGAWTWDVVNASLPISFLVAAILFANNMRDIKTDKAIGVITLAGRLGFRRSKWLYLFFVVGAYAAVLFLIINKTFSLWSFLVLLTAPKALKNVVTVFECPANHVDTIAFMDQQTAQLHLNFGLFLSLSFILSRVL